MCRNEKMLLKKSFQPLETGLDGRRISNLGAHLIPTSGNFLEFSTLSKALGALQLKTDQKAEA